MDNPKIYKFILPLSMFSLIYFSYLQYIVYRPISQWLIGIIQFLGELFTIPLILGVVFSLIFSLVIILKTKKWLKYGLVLIINILSILVWFI